MTTSTRRTRKPKTATATADPVVMVYDIINDWISAPQKDGGTNNGIEGIITSLEIEETPGASAENLIARGAIAKRGSYPVSAIPDLQKELRAARVANA